MSNFWIIVGIVSTLMDLGLIIDRYFFMNDRIREYFVKKTNERGVCTVCERPLKIISDDSHDQA